MASRDSQTLGDGTPYQPVAESTETHTMGDSLMSYVASKLPPEYFKDPSWSRIIVQGPYTREFPARISSIEKRNKKIFNTDRPTITPIDATTLQINCFPGNDYIKNYAAIIATYLSLSGRNSDIVQYHLPNPPHSKTSATFDLFLNSNLSQMGEVNTVILGYVSHLEQFSNDEWEGMGGCANEYFGWRKLKSKTGQSIALLGCRVSFWGDVSGDLIRALQMLNKVRCVLYIGKAGSLRSEDCPNEVIVSGNQSYIGEELIIWNNVLGPDLKLSPLVVEGTNITVSSVLCESKTWFRKHQSKGSWVDCEIGHMARASIEGDTSFGYLHIISDNVARKYPQDLSNENLVDVISKREKLFQEIRTILTSFLEHWNGG